MDAAKLQESRDQQRFEKLTTEFAKENFWRLRNRLGLKYWRILQYAVRVNSNPEHMKKDWECARAFEIVGMAKRRQGKLWEEKRDELVDGALEFAKSLDRSQVVLIPLISGEGDESVVYTSKVRQLPRKTSYRGHRYDS